MVDRFLATAKKVRNANNGVYIKAIVGQFFAVAERIQNKESKKIREKFVVLKNIAPEKLKHHCKYTYPLKLVRGWLTSRFF